MKQFSSFKEIAKLTKRVTPGRDNNSKLHIFFSYNHKDAETVNKIALKLSLEGFKIFLDSWNIKPGDSIGETVNSGLEKSDFFILFWSKNSAKSKWVTKEWNSILNKTINKQAKIIPVKADDSPLPQILSDYQYLTLNNDNTDHFALFEAITGHRPNGSFSLKLLALTTEVIMDAVVLRNFKIKKGGAIFEVVGEKNFWEWEELIKTGSNKCKHKFTKVAWDNKLGSNYGDQSYYFFIYKQLTECTCGAQLIINYLSDKK